MTRALGLLACLLVLGTGCAPRHVATREEVRSNHDGAWTIESLPASTPDPAEDDSDTGAVSGG